VVTGAGRGIGASIAEALAREGFDLALSSRSDSAARCADELVSHGARAFGLAADASDPASFVELVEAARERYGRVDALVNNAGINHSGSVEEMAPEQFDEMYAVNVRGVFFGVQAVLPALREVGGGAIVNIASFVGRTPVPGFTAYSATKAAVLSLTRGHALELAEQGITVNAVCPGNVWSDIWSGATRGIRDETGKTAEQLFEDAIAATPLRRPQTGADIGAATAFLCSDAARNITGEAIYVTGGI